MVLGYFKRVWFLCLHRAWRTKRVISLGVAAPRIQRLTDAINFRRKDASFAALHRSLSEFIVYYCDGAETFASIRHRLNRKFADLNPHRLGDYDELDSPVRGKYWVAPLAKGRRLRVLAIAICTSGGDETDMITLFHELTHPLVLLDTFRHELRQRHDTAITRFADKTEMNISDIVTQRDPSLSRDEWIDEILCECEGRVWWDDFKKQS